MPLRNIEGASRCHFEKGDVLIAQDEKIEYLYYLVEGEVHRELLTPNGVEFILTIKAADPSNYIASLVGVIILYDKHEQYAISNCSFIAHTNCHCYQIPVAAWRQFAKKHDALITKQLLEFVMDNYQVLFDMYYCKKHKNSGAQLCNAILEYAVPINGKLVFSRNISNIELGKRLDIHPTTVSKILHVLVEQGALQKVKGTGFVLVDTEFLKKVASGAIALNYRYQKKA
ncbi:MAG: Crp/Fnr family transcriptional regulator [Peptococcaceae bacterium]|nr:Crp/Fnr family transcriptional regulator [Peptococcaceae bacterium]